MTLHEILPFLIPIAAVQILLFVLTLRHILTHENYRHGNRALWIVITVIGMNFIGPVLYFLLGREDS